MMPDMTRLVDKYSNRKVGDLEWDEITELMGAVAERGGYEALKKLGLDDPQAVKDINDVRDLIKGYRVVRLTVWSQILKVGVATMTLWLLLMFFPREKAKAVIALITG